MAAAVPSVILNRPTCRQPAFAPACGQRRQQLPRHLVKRHAEQQTCGPTCRQRRMRIYATASETLTAPPAPAVRKATGTVFVSGEDRVAGNLDHGIAAVLQGMCQCSQDSFTTLMCCDLHNARGCANMQ